MPSVKYGENKELIGCLLNQGCLWSTPCYQSIGGSSSGYDNAILGDFKYLEKIFHLLEMKLDTVLVKCAEQCDSRNQEIFVERLRDKLIHNINHFDFIFKEP